MIGVITSLSGVSNSASKKGKVTFTKQTNGNFSYMYDLNSPGVYEYIRDGVGHSSIVSTGLLGMMDKPASAFHGGGISTVTYSVSSSLASTKQTDLLNVCICKLVLRVQAAL